MKRYILLSLRLIQVLSFIFALHISEITKINQIQPDFKLCFALHAVLVFFVWLCFLRISQSIAKDFR